MAKLTEEKLRELLQAAGNRLNMQLNPEQQKEAILYMQQNLGNNPSLVDIANTALTGVINVHQTGGIKPLIQVDQGNRQNAPDLNPNNALGGSPLAESNQFDTKFGDSMGAESQYLINMIQNGQLNPELEQWLENNGFMQPEQEQQQEEKSANTPNPLKMKPSPYNK